MGVIGEALGKGVERDFVGRTWRIEPLDLNDLSDLEDYLDKLFPAGEIRTVITAEGPKQALMTGLELLDLSKLKHQRFVLWLTLRKADPQLGDDDRANCRYHLTIEDVGRMLSAPELANVDTAAFVTEVLQISGVLPKDTDTEDREPKKAASASRSRNKSGGSRTSSVSAADTPASK